MARIGAGLALMLVVILSAPPVNARPLKAGGGFGFKAFGGFAPRVVPRALHVPHRRPHIGGAFFPHKPGAKAGRLAKAPPRGFHHHRPKLITWGLPYAAGTAVFYGPIEDVTAETAVTAESNGRPVYLVQREPGCRTEDVVVPRASGGGEARVSVIRC